MLNLSNFKREDGVTLVELLAVIAILAIVGSLLYSFVFQGLNNEKKTSGAIALNQDGNVLMSEWKSQYYAGEPVLCYDENNEQFTIDNYTIVNGETDLELTNGCIHGVNVDEPLEVEVTLQNIEGQSITLAAAWEQPPPSQIALVLNASNSEGVADPNDIDWNYTTNTLPCLDNPQYQQMNIVWTGSAMEKNCEQYNGPNKDKHGTYKSLWKKGKMELENNEHIEVGHHLFTDKKVEIEEGVKITVFQTATFNQDATFEEDAKVVIKGNAQFRALKIEDDAKLEVDGNSNHIKKVEMDEDSTFTIGGSGQFQSKVTMEEDAKLTITNHATFSKKVEMDEDTALTIGGNGTFSDQIMMEDRASIRIGGDATCMKKVKKEKRNSITVGGDSTCS
ncbi:type II secretion system protein [Virgibacillus sp. W0430]|uniref:type II secretion system protein n=1 Tax=Virgibacillus sp. W0430 TaxID=3391580 RepID=UPI003F4740D5